MLYPSLRQPPGHDLEEEDERGSPMHHPCVEPHPLVKVEVQWQANGEGELPRSASVSARPEVPPDSDREELKPEDIMAIVQRPPEVTLTEQLRAQRRVVRNMDSRDLKGLVTAFDAIDDDFISISTSNRNSFLDRDDSVFRIDPEQLAMLGIDTGSLQARHNEILLLRH